MFVGITNTPRDYAWGSSTAIAELLGTTPSGGPEAELWLGTHPGSPSRLSNGNGDLLDVIGTPLPFLLKVLAAAKPLSLQVHPNRAQAEVGFAAENRAGIPVDAPERNYRDPHAKPEMIVSLSDRFVALCGFRPVNNTRALLEPHAGNGAIAGLLARLVDDKSLAATFEWLIRGGPEIDELVRTVSGSTALGAEWEAVRFLAAEYAGDPGIAISLLLNTVILRTGDALYLEAGTIHAYLTGLGIELMTASDNVLRGGFTSKHVDIEQLLHVVDFRPTVSPVLQPVRPAEGIAEYAPVGAPFRLQIVSEPSTISFRGDALALCVAGEFQLAGAVNNDVVSRADACYISADESPIAARGSGMLVIASA